MDGYGLPEELGVPDLVALRGVEPGQVAQGRHHGAVDIRGSDIEVILIVSLGQESCVAFPKILAQMILK